MSLASVVYGGRPVADAEAAGELTLTGAQGCTPLNRTIHSAITSSLATRLEKKK
jgi:hypothetical protein